MRKVFSRLKLVAAPHATDAEQKALNKDIWTLREFANYDYHLLDKIYKDIEKGKFKDESYFRPYDAIAKRVHDSIQKNTSQYYGFPISDWTKVRSGYENIKANFINDMKVFNSVKVGESEDKALSSLEKALRNQELDRFDVLPIDHMKRQIEDFKGTVKINGAADLYLQFKDGKLVKKYF